MASLFTYVTGALRVWVASYNTHMSAELGKKPSSVWIWCQHQVTMGSKVKNKTEQINTIRKTYLRKE